MTKDDSAIFLLIAGLILGLVIGIYVTYIWFPKIVEVEKPYPVTETKYIEKECPEYPVMDCKCVPVTPVVVTENNEGSAEVGGTSSDISDCAKSHNRSACSKIVNGQRV